MAILTDAAVRRLKPTRKRRWVRDAATRGLFLIIQPSGHKSWGMRFKRGGSAAKIFLGPLDVLERNHDAEPVVGQPLSLVAARRLASRLNAEHAAGRDVAAEHRATKHRARSAITEAAANSFALAARDFLVQAKPRIRGWKEIASNLGFDAELEPKRGGLAHRWAARDARAVTASDLYSVVDEARRHGPPGIVAGRDKVSEARARKMHSALSVMYSWLLRHRRVDTNPVATLSPPPPPRSRDRVLDEREIKSFWTATDALTAPFGSVFKMLLLTGARRNEIGELRWDEVSEDGSTLTIPGSRTKNKRTFVIPLPPLGQRLVRTQSRDGTFVFSTTGGVTPISGWSKIKSRLDAAMDAEPWVIHDLRRTMATHAAEIGIMPHIIEALLNHVSGHKASVAGIYNRAAYAPEKKAALERWSKHLQRVVTGKR
jgi:site-specific recombinase XerD